MAWESLSSVEVGEKLKELKFLNKFLVTKYLNNLKVENVSKNLTGIKDFTGQLELGAESKIPHYQLAIEMDSICINLFFKLFSLTQLFITNTSILW